MRKLVIVTGGTKGIGRAIIERFASEGFNIATCSRNFQELQRLKDSVEKDNPGCEVFIFRADMGERTQAKAFANYILSLEQPIEVLVNNAGYFLPGEIASEPEDTLENMINANLYSAYHMTRGVIEKIRKQKRGHIFNMCSIASIMAYKNGGSYAISKFALLGFSKCLREELKHDGVKVTAILPGATWTSSWEGANVPEARLMPADDIATLVLTTYRLSERSVVEELLIRPQLGDL